MDMRYNSEHNAESRPVDSASALRPLPPLDSTDCGMIGVHAALAYYLLVHADPDVRSYDHL